MSLLHRPYQKLVRSITINICHLRSLTAMTLEYFTLPINRASLILLILYLILMTVKANHSFFICLNVVYDCFSITIVFLPLYYVGSCIKSNLQTYGFINFLGKNSYNFFPTYTLFSTRTKFITRLFPIIPIRPTYPSHHFNQIWWQRGFQAHV